MASDLGVRTLVNGQWVTRQLDAHAILARNRQRVESQTPERSFSMPKLPGWAVMTQTLIDPPTIKQMLPAQMRHHGKDYVVFIRSRSVEIHEVIESEDHEFRRIHPKVKVQSPIRAARVFGSFEDTSEVSENKDDIKMELETNDQSTLSDLAPQFVALALDSKKLCFLFPTTDLSGKVEILQSYKELYSGSSYQEQIGEHIAVDPTSRALAVAAHENLFTFMALKTRQALVDEFQAGKSINPIQEEMMIPVDGVILKMEFLYAPSPDAQHVILLLLVHKHEKTRLFCYEWDPLSPSVRTVRQVASGQTLRYEERYPLLLIPLRFASAFMLVCESEFSVYRDILSGSTTSCKQILDQSEGPEEVGLSTKFPVFTQWARPKRSLSHILHEDNVYLCREDGIVQFLEIKDNLGGQLVDTRSQAGRLKVNVNTAFASLNLDPDDDYSGPDYIAAGGDMSNGGLWEFQARKFPEQKSTVPNWTPLSDLVILKSNPTMQDVPSSRSKMGLGSDRIFACTGRGALHGAITEVRYGVRASCLSSTELPDTNSTPSNMWVLDDEGDQHRRLVFISYPTYTLHFTLHFDNSQSPELPGFNLDVPTLAFGTLSEGLIAQVTDNSILLVSARGGVNSDIEESPNVHLVAASFLDSVGDKILLTAGRHNDDIIIKLRQAVHDASGTPGLRECIPSTRFESLQVTSTILHRFGSQMIIGLATSDCHLRIFSVLAGLQEVLNHDFSQDPGGDTAAICDSITVIDNVDEHDGPKLILCGLRNGCVSALLLTEGESWSFELKEVFPVGVTSVKTYAGRDGFALLRCEDTLFYLDSHAKPLLASRLYLDREDRSSLSLDLINAMARIPFGLGTSIAAEISDSWLCVQQHQLLQFDVSPVACPTMVPRHIPVRGSPKHLLFSERLHGFVVIFTKSLVDESQQPGVRRLEHQVRVYELDGPAMNEASLIGLKPGETTLGIIEWFPQPKSDVGEHHLLVLHTSISYGPKHPPSGRILISHIDQQGQTSFKQARAFDGAVSSITPYEPNTVLYCEGYRIGLLRLDPNQKGGRARFSTLKEYALTSRASQVSTEMRESGQRYIYVSTEENSVQVFADSGTTFSLLYSDPQRRVGLCHLKVPETDLILTASTNKLHGLWLPPNVRVDCTAPLVFSATLPGSIRDLKLLDIHKDERRATVIGCGIDGAIYHITIVNEAVYETLSGIQRRLYDHHTSDGPRNGPSVRHIDLDLFPRSFEDSKEQGDDALALLEVRKRFMP